MGLTHPVGKKAANTLGPRDMPGYVFEWCWEPGHRLLRVERRWWCSPKVRFRLPKSAIGNHIASIRRRSHAIQPFEVNMLRVSLVDPHVRSNIFLQGLLGSSTVVQLHGTCNEYDRFVEVVLQIRPDVAIVSTHEDHGPALALIERLAELLPDLSIIAVTDSDDAGLDQDLIGSGANAVLVHPVTLEKLHAALQRIFSPNHPRHSISFEAAPGGLEGSHEIALDWESDEAPDAALDEDLDDITLSDEGEEDSGTYLTQGEADEEFVAFDVEGSSLESSRPALPAPGEAMASVASRVSSLESSRPALPAAGASVSRDSRVLFPPRLLLPRLIRGIRLTSKRLWRWLPLSRSVGDQVDCTVFAPQAASPGERVFIQAFAHLPEQAEIARESAREFDSGSSRRGFKSLEAEVQKGTRLTFHLVIPGTQIDDPVDDLIWWGRPQSVVFIAQIPEAEGPGALFGTLSVSQDSVPIGHVKFKLMIEDPADVRTGLSVPHEPRETSAPGRVNALLSPGGSEFTPRNAPVGMDARRYRKAFVSYASQDRPEVLKRVQMLSGLGIKYFQDVMMLEPGDRWERQLYRHIDECDLFLLFWSTAASKSEWVLREMRYALQHKGDDDLAPPEIKPVIIEGPPPPPPPLELSNLHFNDYFLYFIGAHTAAQHNHD